MKEQIEIITENRCEIIFKSQQRETSILLNDDTFNFLLFHYLIDLYIRMRWSFLMKDVNKEQVFNNYYSYTKTKNIVSTVM